MKQAHFISSFQSSSESIKGQIVPVLNYEYQVIKVKRVKVWLHTFITLILGGGESVESIVSVK
jgi:hypothetical protein